jgi:uncharacterized protein with NRDE domain
MCSLSWISLADGYRLVFNRDERHSRLPARPPEIHRNNGLTWIAPTDGDFGGTWIAVNTAGLTLALVNYYPDIPAPAPLNRQSRGFIIPELIEHSTSENVRIVLNQAGFAMYDPFELLVFDGTEHSFIVRWDGRNRTFRTATPEECPLASSSFVTRPVVEYRKQRFREVMAQTGIPATLQTQFHTELAHPDRAYNPRMFRSEARTVSISMIEVSENEISFAYQPIGPDGLFEPEIGHLFLVRK